MGERGNCRTKFIEGNGSLKKGKVRRRKGGDRKRRQEGSARDRIKSRGGIQRIEVVAHVLVTKRGRRERVSHTILAQCKF